MENNTPVQRRRLLIWGLVALVLYAAGFVLAAQVDLPLTRAAYDPHSFFGILMESFGWYPAFLPSLVLLLAWATRPQLPKNQRWQRPVCWAGAAIGLAALYYVSRGYLIKRGMLSGQGDPLGFIWLGVGALFAGILVYGSLRMREDTRLKVIFFGIWGTFYMAIGQLVMYPTKLFWARTRFDDMAALGSFEAFTPWYQPMGNGGSSFPSGHTGNAAGIFMLLVLCDLFPGWQRYRKAVVALCWGYIAAMAAGRIIIGRHFLSDTLAASAIMAVLFTVMCHTKTYREGLAQTLASAGAPPGREGPDDF